MVKLFVDDLRSAPPGWLCARTVDEAITILREGAVMELSLDYDLGHMNATGLHVLNWLETALESGCVPIPIMTAHSGSVHGRRRLESQIAWLEHRFGHQKDA